MSSSEDNKRVTRSSAAAAATNNKSKDESFKQTAVFSFDSSKQSSPAFSFDSSKLNISNPTSSDPTNSKGSATSFTFGAASPITNNNDGTTSPIINNTNNKKTSNRRKAATTKKNVTSKTTAPKGAVNDLPQSPQDITVQSLIIEKNAELECQRLLPKKKITRAKFDEAEIAKKEGNRLFTQEQSYAKAIEQYNISIRCNPTEASYRGNRSVCYTNLNDHLNALYDAYIATRVAPHWSKGFYRLATTRLACNRYQDAMEAAWTGLQIEPSSPGLVRVFRNSVIKEKMDYENKERMAKAMAAMKKAEKKAAAEDKKKEKTKGINELLAAANTGGFSMGI